jgi:hypothetical protein
LGENAVPDVAAAEGDPKFGSTDDGAEETSPHLTAEGEKDEPNEEVLPATEAAALAVAVGGTVSGTSAADPSPDIPPVSEPTAPPLASTPPVPVPEPPLPAEESSPQETGPLPEEVIPEGPEIITTPPPLVALPTITQPVPGKGKKKEAWQMPVWAMVLGIGLVLVVIVWVIFAFSLSDSFSRIQATETAAAQSAPAVAEETPTATTTQEPPVPTATETDEPTATTQPPTETPVPPLPTDTPVPPTNTPVPPTDTPQPPTETPTPETEPSPTPEIQSGEWGLINPAPGDPATEGLINFEWEWSEPLQSDQGFEIRVWREGEAPLGAHDAVADNQSALLKKNGETSYSLELEIKNALGVQNVTGKYLWTVALIQISPEYADLGQQAEPGTLEFLGEIGIEDLVDNPAETVDNPDSSPQDEAENGGEPSAEDVDNSPSAENGEDDSNSSQ